MKMHDTISNTVRIHPKVAGVELASESSIGGSYGFIIFDEQDLFVGHSNRISSELLLMAFKPRLFDLKRIIFRCVCISGDKCAPFWSAVFFSDIHTRLASLVRDQGSRK